MATINYKMLGALVLNKRTRENLTVAQVAVLCGVSPHTAWRVEQAIGKAEAEKIAAFCRWLDISVERLTGQAPRVTLKSIQQTSESTLDVIHALILRDSKLTPTAQTSLFKIMEIGYMLGTK